MVPLPPPVRGRPSRAPATRLRPDDVADLHRRASVWFAAAGYPEEAVRHALAAGDPDRAADLVEEAVPGLRRERHEGLLRRWAHELPEDVVRARPVLAVGLVGGLMASNDFAGVAAAAAGRRRGAGRPGIRDGRQRPRGARPAARRRPELPGRPGPRRRRPAGCGGPRRPCSGPGDRGRPPRPRGGGGARRVGELGRRGRPRGPRVLRDLRRGADPGGAHRRRPGLLTHPGGPGADPRPAARRRAHPRARPPARPTGTGPAVRS